MTKSVENVFDILLADTDDLTELARIAGADPRFYEGANFRSASPNDAEKKSLSFFGAVNDDGPITSVEEDAVFAALPEIKKNLPFDFAEDWAEAFKSIRAAMAPTGEEQDPDYDPVLDAAFFSHALNPLEKFRVLLSYPGLSQFQKDELIRTFTEELAKFAELAVQHPEDLQKLLQRAGYSPEDLELAAQRLRGACKDASLFPQELLDVEHQQLPPILINTDFIMTSTRQSEITQNTGMLVAFVSWLRDNYDIADLKENEESKDVLKDKISEKIATISRLFQKPQHLTTPCLYFAWTLKTLAFVPMNEQDTKNLMKGLMGFAEQKPEDVDREAIELLAPAAALFCRQHPEAIQIGLIALHKLIYVLNELQALPAGRTAYELAIDLVQRSELENKIQAEDSLHANAVEGLMLSGQQEQALNLATEVVERGELKGSTIAALRFLTWMMKPDAVDVDALIVSTESLDIADSDFGWSFTQIEPLIDGMEHNHQSKAHHFLRIYERMAAKKRDAARDANSEA